MMRTQVVVVIPARMGSSRLPGKPLLEIGDKPVVQHVWERAQEVITADHVVISTDSEEIQRRAQEWGARAVLTDSCQTGTDRTALTMVRYFRDLPGNTVVVNLQGDLPFVEAAVVDSLVETLMEDKSTCIATPVIRKPAEDRLWESPDTVKALMGSGGHGQYFSRSPIPHGIPKIGYWFHHYGVYAFRNRYLQLLWSLPEGRWEHAEGLEQLRAVEAGMRVKLYETYCQPGIEINTPADLAQAREFYAKQEIAA
jgi:3-deoxy-manno-octulosonate cytidylyltransferase (CMP-KDO synthetase)